MDDKTMNRVLAGVVVAGAIPVTQQIVGLGEVLCGIVASVVLVAKLIFRTIQKQVFERQLKNENKVPENDRNLSKVESLEGRLQILNANKEVKGSIIQVKDNLKFSGIIIGIGLLTAIPIVGTITNIVIYRIK